MPWLQTAPALVALAAVRNLLVHRVAPVLSGVPYHWVDAGIAGEHFVLAATAAGLGTCWIGWIRPRAVRRILGLPRTLEVIGLLAVGFPAEPAQFRERLALAEIARAEEWPQPWPDRQ